MNSQSARRGSTSMQSSLGTLSGLLTLIIVFVSGDSILFAVTKSDQHFHQQLWLSPSPSPEEEQGLVPKGELETRKLLTHNCWRPSWPTRSSSGRSTPRCSKPSWSVLPLLLLLSLHRDSHNNASLLSLLAFLPSSPNSQSFLQDFPRVFLEPPIEMSSLLLAKGSTERTRGSNCLLKWPTLCWIRSKGTFHLDLFLNPSPTPCHPEAFKTLLLARL